MSERRYPLWPAHQIEFGPRWQEFETGFSLLCTPIAFQTLFKDGF
jgi:hypothetical protein